MEMTMTTQTKAGFVEVFSATYEWLEIAKLRIDWYADPVSSEEWSEACEAAGFDPEDREVGFSTLIEPRLCDTILRAGDIVATSGPGGDVAFLRRGQ